MRTICVALIVVGLGFLLGCKKRPATTESDKDGGTPRSGAGAKAGTRGTFTIGKSTTFVTGPKDATGHIDYAAALNERLGKGVTAENNANVAIWKILGPDPAGAGKTPTGFFEKMGMQAPTASKEYFIGLRRYAERNGGNAQAAFDSLPTLNQQPWAANQNPTVSGWLQANRKPLDALREAAKKPYYYNPIIPERGEKGSKGLISAPLPGPQACRELAGALAARAMLAIAQNQPAEAWQDLLACHRLGRLVGRGGTLIEGLVGMAVEQIACRGEIAFLDRAQPDANTIAACLKDLSSLPPLANIVEKIDLCERFWLLETIMLLDEQGTGYFANLSDNRAPPAGVHDEVLNGIDWDPALEAANKWFDRLVSVAQERDPPTRARKYSQLEGEINALKTAATGGAALRNATTPAERGQNVGDILVSLMLPAAGKVVDALDRTFQTYENVIVAFALAWYQRFNGQYPATLADLAPTYLTSVPADIFTGKDLIYQPNATGFLLYSVGVNGRDEGGRTYTDQPAGDDLVVRIPIPLKP